MQLSFEEDKYNKLNRIVYQFIVFMLSTLSKKTKSYVSMMLEPVDKQIFNLADNRSPKPFSVSLEKRIF